MYITGFIGPSGTGKSHRALWIAKENNINYIIDDGILVKGSSIVAGKSAKKETTKIGSVKRALFHATNQKKEMVEAIKKENPRSILILGTSDGMVNKIVSRLELGKVNKRIYINEVASEQEMEKAVSVRSNEGKHVIPVPSLEIKQDFSGFWLDPLQIFKRKAQGQYLHIGEKSVVRPTFSYLGKYTISDFTIYQLANNILLKMDAYEKISRFRVRMRPEGVLIDMDVVMIYGNQVQKCTFILKKEISEEVERLTALLTLQINITVKSLVFKKSNKIVGD